MYGEILTRFFYFFISSRHQQININMFCYVFLLGQFCNMNVSFYQDNFFLKTKMVIILGIETGEIP